MICPLVIVRSLQAVFYAETFIRKWQGHPLITPILAPHAPNTNSPEVLAKIIELSRRYQVPVTMHVAEMTYEMAEFEKAYQKHQLLS